MPTLICTEHDGTVHHVQADIGQTVLQAVADASVPGLLGDCGGCCSCATCHAYIDPEWMPRIAPAESLELGMLECAIEPMANSRLTCQLVVGAEFEGLKLRFPRAQI